MKRRFLKKYDGKKQEWFHTVLLLGLMLIVVFILLQTVFGISRVSGVSMNPTLYDGDVVLYLRLGQNRQYGDIVAVKMPSGEKYIKRIIAGDGDEVDLRDGKVYINEKLEPGDFAAGETEGDVLTYPYKVEAGRYFVLGDNRRDSKDSRTFGTVTQKQISGRVILVLWHAK